MFAPLVAVAAAAFAPSPADLIAAEAMIHAPAGAPPWGDRSARARVAVLSVMSRIGAVDPDGGSSWFREEMDWQVEADYARRVVLDCRGCPEAWEGDWLPRAFVCAKIAHANREHAARLRDRIPWEDDRAAQLEAAVTECDQLGAMWEAVTAAAPGSGPCGGWQRPLRVRLACARLAIGEERWERRELPPQAAWWTLTPR